ncbi:hypothetical protein ABH908_000384 [Pseudomonas frederiksbergensis]|uniref:hypothetical protein n=1 Tax=Pseudomonas TaxID=286 RepID=UPI003D229CFE
MTNQAKFNAHITVIVAANSKEEFDLALAKALEQVAKAESEGKRRDIQNLPGCEAQYSYVYDIKQPDVDKPRPAIPPRVER